MKIEVKNLTKKFKNVLILNNISVAFETGKIYGLYGRNGSGKSVFLKLLCGLYCPSSGVVLIDGKNYNDSTSFSPNLRALIERPGFFPGLTGYENLKLLADIQKKITDSEIMETLKVVDLIDEKDKKYHQYSLGMKQKLGIAQALMEDPDIILLDEPFNGIEEQTVKKIINYLKEIKKNKIIIVSTHIKEDLNQLADCIYLFDSGKVEKYEE